MQAHRLKSVYAHILATSTERRAIDMQPLCTVTTPNSSLRELTMKDLVGPHGKIGGAKPNMSSNTRQACTERGKPLPGTPQPRAQGEARLPEERVAFNNFLLSRGNRMLAKLRDLGLRNATDG